MIKQNCLDSSCLDDVYWLQEDANRKENRI